MDSNSNRHEFLPCRVVEARGFAPVSISALEPMRHIAMLSGAGASSPASPTSKSSGSSTSGASGTFGQEELQSFFSRRFVSHHAGRRACFQMPRTHANSAAMSSLLVSPLFVSHAAQNERAFNPPVPTPNTSFERTRSGRPLQAFISFSALRSLPTRASQLKR